MNEKLVQTNERLDQTNERLDQAVGRLDIHSQALAKLVGEVSTLNGRFDDFLTGVHREEQMSFARESSESSESSERLG